MMSTFDTSPENGGSPIISYGLWWDQGVSNWVHISGEFPNYTTNDVEHTVSLLTPSAAYRFKYRAINIFGEGAFSGETIVISATLPDKILPAKTEIEGTDVKISWIQPDMRGDPIQ